MAEKEESGEAGEAKTELQIIKVGPSGSPWLSLL